MLIIGVSLEIRYIAICDCCIAHLVIGFILGAFLSSITFMNRFTLIHV